MSFERWLVEPTSFSSCVGTGFVVLDFITNGNSEIPPLLRIGGSCGNVLTILAYLGWQSYPAARIGEDIAGQQLRKDMERWGVKSDLLSSKAEDKSPIVVHRILSAKNGIPRHQFEFNCPNCGARLPKYKAISPKAVKDLANQVPKANVFYFDRVSLSSLELATYYKSKGALIFFEPSKVKNEKLFVECLAVADIVKYSDERLDNITTLLSEVEIPLEIKTLGSKGLQYRLAGQYSEWNFLNAFPQSALLDTVGSGDWCSAGIIHVISKAWMGTFHDIQLDLVQSALEFGQALAALNCYYKGARGVMYHLKRELIPSMLERVKYGGVDNIENDKETELPYEEFPCPFCTEGRTSTIALGTRI